ncbi:MAG: HDIG domain-containing protein [Prevotella sp.]|nr:HDIG domain-containing protein [Prevotella sp.]
MKRINLNFELTWRDIAWRVALVLAVVTVIVWFMPRDHRPSFKFEQDKPWNYADMTATFDFPVYKSDSVVKAEQEAALKDYEPYYTYDAEVGPEQVRRFMQQFGRDQKGLSTDYKRIIANRLNACYAQGIVDTKSPSGVQLDSTALLRRVDGKDAVSVAAGSVFTGLEVYELLLSDPMLRDRLSALQDLDLNEYIVPNLVYDEERSDQSRIDLMNSVTRADGVVLRGQKIIDRGDIVDESTSRVLQSYLTEIDKRHQGDRGISSTVMGELLYVLLVVLGFTVYLTMYRKDYFDDMRSVGMLYTLLVLFAVLASVLVEHNVLHVYILPFAIVPIFVRVFMDSRTAFMAHTALVLICACILQHPLEFIAVEMAAGLAAIFSLRELSSRSQLFWTATLVTLVAMLTNLSLFLIRSGDFSRFDTSEYYFLLVCGIVIFCSYPLLYIVERTFGFVSNITLIELSDMNKELLRRMSEVAPGTFQHSIQVGNLAAEIARKIGANAQLVRTGALYHDIGKTQNPIYFTENQSGGISPHDHLSLIESAQMIVSHVTEGLKLADHYNLPQQIRDFISTHHGLGKAKYFFIKYKNEHPDEPVDDLLFTYPGPNPFTKEQAVLMMADAVEAASRSLPDYTEQSIRQLVGRIIDSQVQEGYFRDCPITFRDIAYAKTVLIEKLKTIYHTRISYPEAKA